MNTTTTVSAESRITFTDTKPVVTARGGILHGSRLQLSFLTIRVTALTQRDGSVRIHTSLAPTVWGWVYNPDGLTPSSWAFLNLEESQIPAECVPEWDMLVGAVHALHPGLRYSDSPIARRNDARLSGVSR